MSRPRSVCPVACGLDIFGDAWTLLVIRDLLFGVRRFKDLAASPERIPTNLLSERLVRLRRHGLIEQVVPAEGGRHLAYRLTAKGDSLRPLLKSIRDWGLVWEPGTQDCLSPPDSPRPTTITRPATRPPRAGRRKPR